MSEHQFNQPDKRLIARLHAACQVQPAPTQSLYDWRDQPLFGDAGVMARPANQAANAPDKRPEDA